MIKIQMTQVQAFELVETLEATRPYDINGRVEDAVTGDETDRMMFARNSARNDRSQVAVGELIANICGVQFPREVLPEQWAMVVLKALNERHEALIDA